MPIDSEGGETIPRYRGLSHYHGDEVRGIFVLSAIIIIFAQSTGADLPLSTGGAVLVAAALVIVAGITSPRIVGIHWVNAFFAVMGTFLFGRAAVAHYREGSVAFDPSFIYVEVLAILSLIALYLTTRTIRATLLRPPLH